MNGADRLGTLWLAMWLLATVPLASTPALATEESEPGFAAWLDSFRREARARGISDATLDVAFAGVSPIPRVLELDRRQLEFTLTLEEYLARVVPPSRVAEGRMKLAENRALLTRVSRQYGVQPQFLVALWGVETDFGHTTGDFPVIGALATLAWDGRRRDFFRGELLDALQILERADIEARTMRGSWAGAMGQPQFMPSSYRRFAVDFDGDGRTDIWNSRGDVFASAANYLARAGWKPGQRWGREVRLPRELDGSLIGLEQRKRLGEWQALGVRRANGRALPTSPDLRASVVQPDGPGTRAFVVYDNYRAILRWNRSQLFGLAVGTLADRIGDP